MLGREAMKMLMNEACRASGLTRKAIEYYCAQGLLSPETGENGYRRFSEEDVQTLRKIAVLRGLRLSVEEIRAALRREDRVALQAVWNRQGAALEDAQARRALLGRLAKGEDWESVRRALDALDRKQSVLARMREKFPGAFGRFICTHFAPFLDESVRTAEQQEAFDTVIEYLDGAAFELPEDLRIYLEETADGFDGAALSKINSALTQAVQNPEAYIEENRRIIEQYRRYRVRGISGKPGWTAAGGPEAAACGSRIQRRFHSRHAAAQPKIRAILYRAAGGERGVRRSAAINEKKDLHPGREANPLLL